MRAIFIFLITVLFTAVSFGQYVKPTDSNKPSAKSPRWHYERAMVYHLRDQDGKATIELHKALERYKTLGEDIYFGETNFFMAILFSSRKMWAEAEEAVQKAGEHVPAQLLLARVKTERGDFLGAVDQVQKALLGLRIDADFSKRLQNCKTDALVKPVDEKRAELVAEDLRLRLRVIVEEINELLTDSAQSYQEATVDKGLKDPIVYNELVDLYLEEEQLAMSLQLLTDIASARGGFAPTVYIQIGKLYLEQEKRREALEVFEKAIAQLVDLGFSEEAGDFSTEEIRKLKAELNPNLSPKKKR